MTRYRLARRTPRQGQSEHRAKTSCLTRGRYRQAAIAYFVYGAVYLAGAVRELDESRRRNFFGDTIPWWVFYLLGAIFLLIFPLLIAKGIRWLTAALALFTAIKALYLFYRLGADFRWFNLGFGLVALIATILLTRAASMKQSPSG